MDKSLRVRDHVVQSVIVCDSIDISAALGTLIAIVHPLIDAGIAVYVVAWGALHDIGECFAADRALEALLGHSNVLFCFLDSRYSAFTFGQFWVYLLSRNLNICLIVRHIL